jgi:DNA-binding SARP family transcriptional activator
LIATTQLRSALRLRVLGTAGIDSDDGPLSGALTQRKRLALLAILAEAGERGVSRDRLVALLWPERDDRARHLLNQALYAIRREVGEDTFLGTDPIRLNPEALASDLTEFESALARHDLDRVAELYDGPFLDGFRVAAAPEFEHWVDATRARFALAHRQALVTLAGRATRAGDNALAAARWRTLATLDPLDSTVALELMRSLAASGNRMAALQHGRVHVALVRQDLEADADPRILALSESLTRAESATVTIIARSEPHHAVPAREVGGTTPAFARRETPLRLQRRSDFLTLPTTGESTRGWGSLARRALSERHWHLVSVASFLAGALVTWSVLH